jgi:hypothetical protein
MTKRTFSREKDRRIDDLEKEKREIERMLEQKSRVHESTLQLMHEMQVRMHARV